MNLINRIDSLLSEGKGYIDRNESYYYIEDARRLIDLEEVMRMWIDEGRKAMDDTKSGQSYHGLYDMRDIWPYREYEWTRDLSRGGYVDGESYSGKEKWDKLVDVMSTRGWSEEYPVILNIGQNGQAKIGEGNHRLATAREAGVRKVPVVFAFERRVNGHPYQSPRGPLKNVRAMRDAYKKAEKESQRKKKELDRKKAAADERIKNLDPDEREKLDKRVDDIMGILGR